MAWRWMPTIAWWWHTITNVAFVPGTSQLVLTDSEQGHVLVADLPAPGLALFSHR